MELDELKSIWKDEQKELESKIFLNEDVIKGMNIEKSRSRFTKLLKVSIWGRNLALVYMVISVLGAIKADEIEYSIPAILGGMAMLWSFIQHFSLKTPAIDTMNVLELQKSIYKFRIHISKYAKYDIGIVLFWLITLAPIYLKEVYSIFVYSSYMHFFIFSVCAAVVIFLVIMLSNKTYKEWDSNLKESETQLNKIKEFESAK